LSNHSICNTVIVLWSVYLNPDIDDDIDLKTLNQEFVCVTG